MALPTNDILYRIKKALNLTEEEILQAYQLADFPMEAAHLSALLKRRYDKAFIPCSYEELGLFLDGLILLKRGPSPRQTEKSDEVITLTNNLILKKLRIALMLKEMETEIIFNLADITLSRQELKSLFRKEGHKNFKPCSDMLLMGFLEGLAEFCYSGQDEDERQGE